MKNLLRQSFRFIKENPRIIYSLALVFIVPLTIFLNTYFILDKFRQNIRQVISEEALLAKSIISSIVRENLNNELKLREILAEIQAENEDIERLEILIYEKESQDFKILVSTDPTREKQEISTPSSFQNALAWKEERGIAFLDSNEKGRFWTITKSFNNEAGDKIGLISLSLSMKKSDAIISKTEINSYLLVVFTIIIVLLLVANNARLFGYALTLSKLKEIDRMKDTFISMASHELRAPLISMKGNAEFLEEDVGPYLNEDGKRYIRNIAVSIERLEMLVNDILEVSRIEGNRLPVNIIETESAEIIAKSIEETKIQAVQKGLLLESQAENLPKIKVDPERTKQILINLISNAIKYTLKGKIQITAEQKNRMLAITVADSGVGISAEDQAKLFQKFSRIYNEETKDVIGTGLGLWIARELARKMGGDITVESIRGVGSHFTLSVPLA